MYDRSGRAKVVEVLAALVFASVAFVIGMYIAEEKHAQFVQEVGEGLNKIENKLPPIAPMSRSAHQGSLDAVRYKEMMGGKLITIHLLGAPEHRIDIDMLIQLESSGDPNAHNKKTGARGLCQILEPTWNECTKLLGVDWDYLEDCNDPLKNKAIGIFYVNNRIPQMMDHYNMWPNKQTRLACHNWGIGNVKKLMEKNPHCWEFHLPKETRKLIYDYFELEDSR